MSEEEIEAMLMNLSIEIERKTEFGPVDTIKVKLYYCDQLISESSETLD